MQSVFVFLHIAAGSTAILSGFVSLIPKKGSKLHLQIGRIFYYSMLLMAGSASFMAVFMVDQPINFAIGLFTIYLVLTSRWTANNHSGKLTSKEKLSVFIAFGILVIFAILSYDAVKSGEAVITGVYVEAFYVYTVLAVLALALDVKVVLKKGVFGAQRIARHLWRMILALFIASGSLFLGQPQVFPEFIRDSGALEMPVLLVVLTLFFWMIRVFVGKRFRVKTRTISPAAS